MTPMRRKVWSRRNSLCGSAALDALSRSEWWTDCGRDGPDRVYLHVADARPDMAGASHRVFCRHPGRVEIGMHRGALVWVVCGDKL